MQLKFKHQKFQEDAAKAVCDVFAGQLNIQPTYRADTGKGDEVQQIKHFIGEDNEITTEDLSSLGYKNNVIRLSDQQVLDNIQRIQRSYQIEPSEKLETCVIERKNEQTGRNERVTIKYNLTVEMETGTGKTYVYIKTMYELNKRYGFKKFIVIVPSVAIREGVYKSFQITQSHFAEDYSKKIRFFIYNSAQLPKLDSFANDSGINVMIINSQAFNARGKDARRIYMKLDSFRSRRPIDVIASTNPILIIDEPQSTEGKVTKEKLPEFNPLMILRYSATHKKDSIYNMIYRLDAMEAYNKHLVKKIAVKGISTTGSTATEGYLYLQGLILSPKNPPKARLEYDIRRANRTAKATSLVTEGYNLYEHSGLEQYKGYIVSKINGLKNTVEFLNGVTISVGDVVGAVNEDQIRRIQIRETIKSHLERERELFYKGIKVLSLFFIDEVAKYKQYDKAGKPYNGEYADVFEEEYENAVNAWQVGFGDDDYLKYLNKISTPGTHSGYFSIDKKSNRMVDGSIDRKERQSDDVDAYDLIMRDKERLLDLKEPVRFIFSHSALREGWDNPNVFQICTLKQSGSDVRKRQEVGRGLRLCVNNAGERMDENVLGRDVHSINVLTVVANESYDEFAKRLQTEMAEVVADRPREVNVEFFENKVVKDSAGNALTIDHKLANKLFISMAKNEYIDEESGSLTNKYYDDKSAGKIIMPEDVHEYKESIVNLLDSIYNPKAFMPENALDANAALEIDKDKLNMKEFKALWERINSKTAYIVDFDTDELIQKSIDALDIHLVVSQIFYRVETGSLGSIKSKEDLEMGIAMKKTQTDNDIAQVEINVNVKYDLIGKLVSETGLTRSTLVKILQGIKEDTFEAFKHNPEEFIIKAGNLINEQKATVIVSHITYELLNENYDTEIFTEPTLKRGKLGVNAIEAKRNLYNYIITDSDTERSFAQNLDLDTKVAVYVKLPSKFYINTPVGKYNPDWAIAFYEGTVKHIYFVAETKGDLSTLQLKEIEDAKVKCARKHFQKISTNEVKYEVVKSYDDLLNRVMK